MEPIVKKWYEYLREGKLMGLKCKRCGNIDFPPVPVCSACSAMNDYEWVEMSGDAQVVSFSFSPFGIPPYHDESVMGLWVKMKEGPQFMSWSDEIDDGNVEELMKELPMDVEAEIRVLDDEKGICFPVFRRKS